MFDKLANEDSIKKTVESLNSHSIKTEIAKDLKEAKKITLELIPEGSEVLTMTSVTLDESGISKELDESGNYKSIRTELYRLDSATESDKMRKLAAAPDYAVGSANAVSEEGALYWASATGSQLAAYAYTAGKVIMIVGANKIVKDREAALKRIYEYVLPFESERARKAYGVPGSAINKLLEISAEANPHRITVIIVKEKAGY